MVSKLLSHIRTVEERDRLLAEVDLLMSSIYEEQGKGFEKVLKSKIRFWVMEIIKDEVENDNLKIEKYLKGLKTDLIEMKTISLKLAFEPTEISIDKFHDYIKNNIKIYANSETTATHAEEFRGVILDISYDPNILGGAAITWKGEYRDFSLQRLFEEEYEAKKPDILKIMYSK